LERAAHCLSGLRSRALSPYFVRIAALEQSSGGAAGPTSNTIILLFSNIYSEARKFTIFFMKALVKPKRLVYRNPA
jgi:hypothetical protein